MVRFMREHSVIHLVASYQRFAEAMFEKMSRPADVKARKNVFQTVDEAGRLWNSVCGKGYEQMLSAQELSSLTHLFQQRHLLEHKGGLVDQEYLDKSGDRTYRVGQRIVIQDADVLRLADLVTRLAAGIRKVVPGGHQGQSLNGKS